MLKIKSRSLMVTDPVDPELKDHVAMLLEKQEEQMRLKLERQSEKEARIEAIERQFVEWADRKEGVIRSKLQKSVKNKEDHLNKIVKKCKDHQKFLNQKYKNIQSKKKANIKEAWKKAQKFNHSIQDYHQSKFISKDNHLSAIKSKEDMTESRFLQPKFIQLEKDQSYITQIGNQSKYYSNASKDYWVELNQSIKSPHIKMSQSVPKDEKSQEKESAFKIHHTSKLKETIARFKQHLKDEEQGKIQQLAQRLQKIQKSRIKRVELSKKRREPREDEYLQTQHIETTQKKKPKTNKSQRIHSETIMRQKRVTDWSDFTKQRREQHFLHQMQNGNHYLQHEKMKYLKTSLAKKIAGSAIEKKLYFQRLNH